MLDKGGRILAKVDPGEYTFALRIDGSSLSSQDFAAKLNSLALQGKSRLAFIIGGSLGLSGQIGKRANASLSLSKMTFPHQLTRVVLLEQIYRAFRIIRNEPYHK